MLIWCKFVPHPIQRSLLCTCFTPSSFILRPMHAPSTPDLQPFGPRFLRAPSTPNLRRVCARRTAARRRGRACRPWPSPTKIWRTPIFTPDLRLAAGGPVATARQGRGDGLERFTPDLRLGYARQREGLAPPFFKDEELAYSKDWKLSTSNISVAWNDGFTFGPVTEHCYGERDFLFVYS